MARFDIDNVLGKLAKDRDRSKIEEERELRDQLKAAFPLNYTKFEAGLLLHSVGTPEQVSSDSGDWMYRALPLCLPSSPTSYRNILVSYYGFGDFRSQGPIVFVKPVSFTPSLLRVTRVVGKNPGRLSMVADALTPSQAMTAYTGWMDEIREKVNVQRIALRAFERKYGVLIDSNIAQLLRSFDLLASWVE